MTQAPSQLALRNRNLSLVLGTLLRHDETTRKHIEREAELSKATVSRLVEELLQSGTLAAEPILPSGRGRPSEALRIPTVLGVTLGLSLGIRTTSVCVTDLAARRIARYEAPTPPWTSFDEAVEWALDVTRQALQESEAPVRNLVLAVPARALGGTVIAKAPLFMASIEGPEFAQALAEHFDCPVSVELDAAMMLAGLRGLGSVDENTHPVLLNAGSVLTMAMLRRDGTIAGGGSPSFGDFSLVPFTTALGPARLGDLLGGHGLFETSRLLGSPLASMDELWETDTDEVRQLRAAFFEALMQVIRIVVVMSDPHLIIFTGRLAPLVDMHLADVRTQLDSELGRPPALRIKGHAENDHLAAVGAAEEARKAAVVELLDRVSLRGLEGLQ